MNENLLFFRSSQESAIVQDLLYCFVGINGVHVRYKFLISYINLD